MKTASAVIFILLGLLGMVLLFFIPQGERVPSLERLGWDDLDISANFQDRKTILSGIEKSILVLQSQGEKQNLAGLPVSKQDILKSLQGLRAVFRLRIPDKELYKRLQRDFQPWEVTKKGRKDPVLVTGYFQPSFRGSLNATADYSFPVYGWPPDLLKANLQAFDPALPHVTIWGRSSNRRFVPYYSRKEIEERDLLPPETALCWLSSPVEVLELHIQGSGIINFPDGTSRFIHYAASNGLKYKSIGKVLLKQGVIPREKLDWPGIKQWAEAHPERFRKVSFENPRYVFFRWEEKGPIGCYGRVLVPGASVALDSTVYPPGVPGLLVLKLPNIRNGPNWFKNRPDTLLVFNHDRGSAIKGPFRVDLYCGTGQQAGSLAGRLKSPARLILLLNRDIDMAGS